jgi:hypothetical protein
MACDDETIVNIMANKPSRFDSDEENVDVTDDVPEVLNMPGIGDMTISDKSAKRTFRNELPDGDVRAFFPKS